MKSKTRVLYFLFLQMPTAPVDDSTKSEIHGVTFINTFILTENHLKYMQFLWIVKKEIAAHAVHQLAAGDKNGLIKNIGVNSDEFERLADIKKRQTR